MFDLHPLVLSLCGGGKSKELRIVIDISAVRVHYGRKFRYWEAKMASEGRDFLDSAGTLQRIGHRLHAMTPVNRRIGEFVLRNPDLVVKMSISRLAREANVRSESSVVRFYQCLGYSGYHDFKVSLATDIAGQTFYHATEDIGTTDSIGTIKTKLFDGAVKTLQQNKNLIPDEVLGNAVELISEASRLIILGYAASAAVEYDAYFKLTRLGIVCHFSTDPHVNAVLLSEAREGDVVLAISQSGESRDVVVPLRSAHPPVRIVAITGEADSALARISDVCVVTYSEERNYRTDALISRIVQKVLVSVLYTGVAIHRGESIVGRLHASRRSLSYLKF
jgi:RpiR family transcriptional regulator, carbohydrate utilization regulator